MAERTRKTESRSGDRRANRTILGRTIFLMVIFGVVVFIPLFWKLWDVQISQHDKLEEQAIDQQTRDLLVTAPRGTIYDAKGNRLAVSADVHNIVISPKDIVEGEKAAAERAVAKLEKGAGLTQEEKEKKGCVPTDAEIAAQSGNYAEFIAQGLSQILGVEEEKILKRMENTAVQYEVVKWRVEDDITTQVRQFISDYQLYPGVYVEPDTKRYYPSSDLAAHVVGWVNVNDNNKGAYGVEAQYESYLAGKAGRVVTAKNAAGTEMLSSYENYIDAIAGGDLHLTIDNTIQSYAQRVMDEGIAKYDVQEGAFCIVMDPNTGAVLAMASSPDYDLNSPREITDSVLSSYVESVRNDPSSNDEAYAKALQDAQYSQWRNKALNDTYEPGSTFKTLVLSAALEEGVVSESDHFYCSGVKQVANWPIRCSKREGHGDQTLRQAVMNSCNPAFIEIGQRLGAEKFWEYLENYGLMERTGIDLQGEGQSQFWDEEEFVSELGIASLATASFGQRFQITPIQMITAACAAVNGGRLMQPYVVQSITDSDGNVIQSTQPTQVRQVISEATSAQVRSILGSVVMDGGTGKNAYQAGYSIGGKTGTSETNQSKTTGRLIVSFLGVAPAENPQIVVLLGYDHPKPAVPGSNLTAGGYYISGGNMAAPMAGELIADILDYLGVEKQYKADELADVVVPKVTELSLNDAQDLLKQKGLQWRTVGEGGVVTDQIPAQGASIPGSSQVVLYLGAEKPTDQVPVPDVSGKTLESAQTAFAKVGLYLRPSGSGGSYSSSSTVAVGQSITAGAMVDPGTVVDVQFIDTDIQDYANNTGIR